MSSALDVPVRHERGELGAISQIPLQPALELRHFLEELWFEGLDREQRNQTDHGTEFQRHHPTVGQMQHIVEELILLVPHTDARLAKVIHRARNLKKMFEKLRGDILVDRIVLRELERDA